MARIAGINIPQNKVVSIALTYIHGIGLHSSKKICKKLEIPTSKRVNELSEEQVLKIREIIDANNKLYLRQTIYYITHGGMRGMGPIYNAWGYEGHGLPIYRMGV